jgi:hypothetical protein
MIYPTHRVMRSFDGTERPYNRDELIDTSSWDARRVRRLVEQRWLTPIPIEGCPDPSAHVGQPSTESRKGQTA